MARLIRAGGVLDRVGGFATNVSNYQTTSAEFDYAHELSELLGGAHAIVDTSRNGAGPAGDDWCNPPDRLIGDARSEEHTSELQSLMRISYAVFCLKKKKKKNK